MSLKVALSGDELLPEGRRVPGSSAPAWSEELDCEGVRGALGEFDVFMPSRCNGLAVPQNSGRRAVRNVRALWVGVSRWPRSPNKARNRATRVGGVYS